MKKILMAGLVTGVISLGLTTAAHSAQVTKSFWGVFDSGPFLGMEASGSFTYDDALVVRGDEVLGAADGLQIVFNFDSQVFTEADDVDYPDYPHLEFVNSAPDYLDYWVILGLNDFYASYLDPYVGAGGYDYQLTMDSSAVPVPGAVWLLGSGLAGLVGLRRKK